MLFAQIVDYTGGNVTFTIGHLTQAMVSAVIAIIMAVLGLWVIHSVIRYYLWSVKDTGTDLSVSPPDRNPWVGTGGMLVMPAEYGGLESTGATRQEDGSYLVTVELGENDFDTVPMSGDDYERWMRLVDEGELQGEQSFGGDEGEWMAEGRSAYEDGEDPEDGCFDLNTDRGQVQYAGWLAAYNEDSGDDDDDYEPSGRDYDEGRA